MSQTWHKVLPHFRDLGIIINRQGCGVHTLCTSNPVHLFQPCYHSYSSSLDVFKPDKKVCRSRSPLSGWLRQSFSKDGKICVWRQSAKNAPFLVSIVIVLSILVNS
jgi:hypothetical protein